MNKDSLGDRMKGYEDAFRLHLPERLPVIVRIDGRAFHTFTRGLKKPFDDIFRETMNRTAIELCENISGCKMAYVQSDEISLLLLNNDSLETKPWFGNNFQKIVSVSAAMATRAFNNYYRSGVRERSFGMDAETENLYFLKVGTAEFDSRAFILPEYEVVNYFIWRQQDATRNSIQMVARSLYSHNELNGKNSKDLQEMLFQKGVNWNDYPVEKKRGICVVKKPEDFLTPQGVRIVRDKWTVDKDIPVFTQDRNYIESRFKKEEVINDDMA